MNGTPEGFEPPSLAEAQYAFARDYLMRVLAMHGGNIARAAKAAGRTRPSFYRLLDRYGVKSLAQRPACAHRGNWAEHGL